MKKAILFILLLFCVSSAQELKIKEKKKYNGEQILVHKNTILIGRVDSLTNTYVIDSILYLEEK